MMLLNPAPGTACNKAQGEEVLLLLPMVCAYEQEFNPLTH
jgi:hypothetical protein